MRRRGRRCAALALACALAATAAAQDAAPATPPDALPSLSEEEIAEVFARMDSDRDGQVSLEEFESGIRRPYGAEREGVVYQKLPARFRVLDADGDGFLEASEYARLGERWQLPGSPPALALADRNRDGRIDFREFALLHAPHEATAADAGTAAR
jgi:hypothetical protein